MKFFSFKKIPIFASPPTPLQFWRGVPHSGGVRYIFVFLYTYSILKLFANNQVMHSYRKGLNSHIK